MSNKPTLFDFRPVRDYNPLVPTDFDKLIQWLVATREEKRPESAEQVRHVLQAINQWASIATSALNGNGIATTGNAFYDSRTARAAQSVLWLTRINKLPGQLGVWWAQAIIPLLANIYGGVAAWFVLICLPFLKQLSGKGTQRVSVWISSLSKYHLNATINFFTPPVWTASFVTLFTLLPIVTVGGSLYMLNVQHTAPPIIALYLSMLLFLITLVTCANKNIHPLARSILLATSLAMLTVIVALQSLSDVQQTMRSITFNHVLSGLIITFAVISLLRPADRFSWVDHLAVATIAAGCALLQTIFGQLVLQQLLPSPSTDYAGVNFVLVGILGVVAVVSLIRFRSPFAGIDRVLLLVVAFIYMGLQYTFGLQEITQSALFSPNIQGASPLNLVVLNLVLIGVPGMSALLWLFLVKGSSSMSRVPLLLLALVCAIAELPETMLHGVQQSPYTKLLGVKVLNSLDANQLVAYGLVLCTLLLFFRLGRNFTWLDRVVIFCVAIACTLLQGSSLG